MLNVSHNCIIFPGVQIKSMTFLPHASLRNKSLSPLSNISQLVKAEKSIYNTGRKYKSDVYIGFGGTMYIVYIVERYWIISSKDVFRKIIGAIMEGIIFSSSYKFLSSYFPMALQEFWKTLNWFVLFKYRVNS